MNRLPKMSVVLAVAAFAMAGVASTAHASQKQEPPAAAFDDCDGVSLDLSVVALCRDLTKLVESEAQSPFDRPLFFPPRPAVPSRPAVQKCDMPPTDTETQEWSEAVKAAQGFWNKVVVKDSWSFSRAFARALCEKLKELVERVTERTGSAAARTLNRVVARVRNAAVVHSAPHYIPLRPLPRICCVPARPHLPEPRRLPRPPERRFGGK